MRYFLTLLVLLLSCSTHPEDVPGCVDSSSCNYNPDANIDDGSCIDEPDMCGTCDNDPSNDCIQDCAGVWGGTTTASDCEICLSNSGEFDCAGNCCKDDLIYNTDSLFDTGTYCSIEDKCGVCDGDGWNNGLSCDDIFILQQIIDTNNFSIQQSALNVADIHPWDYNANSVIEFSEFGVQNWSEGGRLIYLKVDIPIVLTNDIGGLSELRELVLETNELTEIPEAIDNLQKLKILNITSNPLILLPSSIIELTNLEELLISKNSIIDLPENIGNLTKLTRLDVSYNMLDTLPESISSLNNLMDFFLENNQINVLPASFANLSNIIELRLNNNKLEILPESFGQFGELIYLYLNHNQLHALPENFGNMSNLKKLYLHNNNLDSLSGKIGNMNSLEELWLQNNELINLSDEIGLLSSLKILRLNDNKLEILPDNLCNIYSGLIEFPVRNNYLCSPPGDCMDDLDLEYQYCSTNNCPPEQFPPIEDFCVDTADYYILQNFLDLNPYSQSLPPHVGIPTLATQCVNPEWWHEGRLIKISFQHKNLRSIIPDNFGDLDKLQILELNSNELIGEIPDNLMNLLDLKILKLNSNELNGTIPENIGILSKLDSLILSYNNFTGEIPAGITEIDSLTCLFLNNNNFSGPIPEEIGSIDNLRYLHLEQNLLSGTIPQSFGNLEKIQDLYLHTNELSGEIPENICTIYDNNEYVRIMLEYNDLCPPFPECIPQHHLGNQNYSDCEEP